MAMEEESLCFFGLNLWDPRKVVKETIVKSDELLTYNFTAVFPYPVRAVSVGLNNPGDCILPPKISQPRQGYFS